MAEWTVQVCKTCGGVDDDAAVPACLCDHPVTEPTRVMTDASHRKELAESLGEAREYLLTHRHIKDVDEADSMLAGLILALADQEDTSAAS